MDPRAAAGEAVRWLEDKLEAMEAELRALVEINSFTDNREGGVEVGRLLREVTLAAPGLEAEVWPSTRYADHVLVRSGGDGRAPVALIGHLDTVFPPGTFEGYRCDGALARGPGVLDMKGGLVVMGFAIRAIAATVGLAAAPPLRIAVVSEEEVGSPESQPILVELARGCGAALTFESGRAGDLVITRRKGTGAARVIAHGKAAHAGNGHREGANALWALARFIDQAQALTDYDRGVTVNVGKVTGGLGKNTVPDLAEALVDLRFCTVTDAEALFAAVRAAGTEAAAGVAGTSLDVKAELLRAPLERTEASAALAAEYGAAARASGLGHAEAGLIGGGSDASTTGAMGIPSIDGLGPRGLGFHTIDEHIELATLVPKAQALARFLLTRAS